MEWTSYPENRPAESGAYIVSISRPYSNGDLTFKYVAYYNVDNNQWFKYDPFSDENDILERITFRINGWVANATVYLR